MKVVKIILLMMLFQTFISCDYYKIDAQTSNSNANTKNQTVQKIRLNHLGDSYNFPTLYWAPPRPVALNGWYGVFGGTVVELRTSKEKFSDNQVRKFRNGKIKVEKIFLILTDNSDIKVNSLITSAGFEGLRKGDKVIFFVDFVYEEEYVRTDIEGTGSKLGFKIKDWNEPIVSALEKISSCNKTKVSWVEGHSEDFRVKVHDCNDERDRMILEDKEISEVWKRYDPKGYQQLVERSELLKDENQNK